MGIHDRSAAQVGTFVIKAIREPHDPESVLRVTMESAIDLRRPEQGVEYTSSIEGVLVTVRAWLTTFIESAGSTYGSEQTSSPHLSTTD